MDDGDEKILSRTLERGGLKPADGSTSQKALQKTATAQDDITPDLITRLRRA